ncbi:WXG100 family type VII secretion target [Streptomyces sp. NPDC088725]|uniref:WXG100 family type VII secretion target n=1 Tax=Streptomyces sp. NPDC088725 TaxID=3365873 RepID=UPI00383023B5
MAYDDGTMVVTYSSLEGAARDIRAQAKALETSLSDIQAKIASVSDVWAGDAREAYNTAQAKWNKEAAGIHQALDQIARAVESAAPAYQSGDKRAAANFQ